MSFLRRSGLVFAICAGLWSASARAVDAFVLEVHELSVGGVSVESASARLDILDETRTRLTLGARAATLPDPVGRLSALSLVCESPVIAEPRYACDHGSFVARGGPTGAVRMVVAASYDTAKSLAKFSGRGLKVAGATAAFDGWSNDAGWRVKFDTDTTRVAALREFAKPWLQLPADITGDGKADLHGTAASAGKGMRLSGRVNLAELDLTNDASTIVTDKLAASMDVDVNIGGKDTTLQAQVQGRKGQMLVGPVLLDFARNPLDLKAQAALRGDVLTVQSLSLQQKDLLDLAGSASVNLAGDLPRVDADLRIARLEFPAAYSSYLQITLASTLLGDADTAGWLQGEVAVRDNAPTSLHLVPRSLVFHDRKDRLFLAKIDGEVYWTPAGVEAPYSRLSWAEGGAFGLSGGAASIEFVARGANFALMKPTKLPILDGALAIDTLAMGNLGASNMEVTFEGEVEPISMPRLATVFGWPAFQGTLAAHIPAVKLKDNVLSIQGNVESQVFGGRVVGSNIRLQDPLGNFPQFFADVRARDLDLGLVTQTFEVGSITGRLEADVLNLELFGWSPVSFDARLATPKGDKSRHRISAKAVTSLSNVGGGGGGVVQALQSGLLRFFDEYSYDKLGITCKLRNDICEMSGVEPAGIGYYIVKGAGLPRIDIVGNAGRVRWSQLVSSIATTNFGGASAQ